MEITGDPVVHSHFHTPILLPCAEAQETAYSDDDAGDDDDDDDDDDGGSKPILTQHDHGDQHP